jgi:hypothetical protein
MDQNELIIQNPYGSNRANDILSSYDAYGNLIDQQMAFSQQLFDNEQKAKEAEAKRRAQEKAITGK